MTASESPTLAMSFELIRSRLSDPEFLEGRGISNEVPFYIFAYDAAQEDEVRTRTEQLITDAAAGLIPAHIVHFDLWEIFREICAYYDIVDDLERLESQKGSDALLAHIREIAMPEDFVTTMAEQFEAEFGKPQPGRDVVLVTGVGKVYPFVRAHDILENAQPVFDSIPFVMFYPGQYDQQTLRLFNSIADGNYYRAFTLL